MFDGLLRIIDGIAAREQAEYMAYMAQVNNLALCFIIVAIIVAIVLGIAKKKTACITWIICWTVFWFFGGFVWLASLFISY